jgi:hypothetical protein
VLEDLREDHPEIPEICFIAAKLLLGADIPSPRQVDLAYDPAILLIWTDISIQVGEVDYEYYDVGRGRTDIRHFPHSDGKSVAVELLTLVRENA